MDSTNINPRALNHLKFYNSVSAPKQSKYHARRDDASEAANLKKDLELQRFLKESHLLESSTDHIFTGKNRHKATDLRLQALGSKTSILKQEKMPMSHRRVLLPNKAIEKRSEERRQERTVLYWRKPRWRKEG